MSPLDEAFHDWADRHEGDDSAYAGFVGGWEARTAELERLGRALERQRRLCDRLSEQLGHKELARAAAERQRDDLARALLEVRQP